MSFMNKKLEHVAWLAMPILIGVAREAEPPVPLPKEGKKHTHTGHLLPDFYL
jgi:hypothetical protein